MTRRGRPFLAALVLTSAASNCLADDCRQSCVGSIPCHQEVTDCLIDTKRTRDAIDRLKILREKHPDEPAYGRLLARSYLADDNAFWAERVLLQLIENDPSDCESRSWLVWIYLQNGDLTEAQRTMTAEERCPRQSEDQARWHVLEGQLARAEGNAGRAEEAFENLGDADAAYPEDVAMWRHLNLRDNPGWIEPLSVRLMVSGGYTSNARAGSPADPTASEGGTALGRFDLFSRFVTPSSHFFRPALEGDVKGHGLTESDARELSYLDLSIRPGVVLGRSFPRVLVAYRGNLLLIGLDGKERFFEAHRGELELETDWGLLVFAGAGRRIFKEGGRNRTELDGGLGGSFSIGSHLMIMAALSAKGYFAVGDAYDQAGGIALLVGRVDFGPGFYGRIGVTSGVDYYPNSGGDMGFLAFGTDEKRFDATLKQFEEIWSPSWHGGRIGLRYELSYRNSTADDESSNYDYVEHRALLNVRWVWDVNPWQPRKAGDEAHVPLDYHLAAADGQGLDEERIQDLLRQDEAARAGSSCVE